MPPWHKVASRAAHLRGLYVGGPPGTCVAWHQSPDHLRGSPSPSAWASSALSLHLSEVSPLLHDTAIWKPANAVLTARTFADLALATALHAEYRCWIRQRPSSLGANGQRRKHEERDWLVFSYRAFTVRQEPGIIWGTRSGFAQRKPPTADIQDRKGFTSGVSQ
jgi:hypothetical protein